MDFCRYVLLAAILALMLWMENGPGNKAKLKVIRTLFS